MSNEILKSTTPSANGEEKQPEAPDPFDITKLRLAVDYDANAGVRPVTAEVPVRKPAKEWWIRARPEPEYSIVASVLELKEDRELYWVDQDFAPDLQRSAVGDMLGERFLSTAINRQGTVFIWPLRVPDSEESRKNAWNSSALEAAAMAKKGWVRVAASIKNGFYNILQPTVELPEPEWPDLSISELLRIAFRNLRIASHDHPVLKKLRGEV